MNKQNEIEVKLPKVGDRIRFLQELTQDANEETPAFLFARKDDFGIIVALPNHTENYSVKWDGWLAPFYLPLPIKP